MRLIDSAANMLLLKEMNVITLSIGLYKKYNSWKVYQVDTHVMIPAKAGFMLIKKMNTKGTHTLKTVTEKHIMVITIAFGTQINKSIHWLGYTETKSLY